MIQGGSSIYSNGHWKFAHPKYYSNGSWKDSIPYIYINNEWKILEAAGTQMVFFITSDGKYFVTSDGKYFLVRETEAETVLSSISLISFPIKTLYKDDELFDPSGLEIEATLTNGNQTYSFSVPLSNLSYSKIIPNDGIVPISFTYKDITKTIRINVSKYVLSNIIFDTTNIKTKYLVNDTFDISNLVITKVYTFNGNTLTEGTSNYTLSINRPLIKTDTQIVISCESYSKTVDINVYNPSILFTNYSRFNLNNLTNEAWLSTDGTKAISLANGTWNVENGKLVANGSTGFRTPVPQANILVGIRCSVPSTFVPQTNTNWYKQSCLIGKEISGTERDFGVTLFTNNGVIYPCIGYSTSSYTRGSTPLPLDTEFELYLYHTGSKYYLILNNQVIATQSYTASGAQPTTFGICWNDLETVSRIPATVSAVGIWEFTNGSGTDFLLPSLDNNNDYTPISLT